MIKGPAIMYTTQSHPGQNAINNIGGDLDGSGTINPAALNSSGSALPNPNNLNSASMQSPRGQKRSRSPEHYSDMTATGAPFGDNDDRPKKRGRPPKERGPDDLVLKNSGQPTPGQLPTPQTATHNTQSQHQAQQQAPSKQQLSQQATATAPGAPQQKQGGQQQRSQSQQQGQQQAQQQQQQPKAPAAAGKQSSPAKPAPGKSVVKALPTVRDHTTDQLNPENDEYIPRETDPDGDKKVQGNGRLTGGREYKCRTFLVPNRGDKLFMLATECARVLGYRDSYLLFNKNRSLYKIIATQAEKDDLIHQDILPYSYRSRQIAIVTARSMFRQFGSRVVTNGRRVRDDYWEAKARKQGFTEEDLAGEKRPGAAKREAAAAQEAAANAAAQHPHNDVIYSNPMDSHGHPMPIYGGLMGNTYPLPMITPAPSEDSRRYDYNNIARPKQEISGAPYQDKTQVSSMPEVMSQAGHTSEFNRLFNQQRAQRSDLMKDHWRREQPVSSPVQADSTAAPAMSQAMQSPHMNVGNQQQMLPPQGGQAPGYQQQPAAAGGAGAAAAAAAAAAGGPGAANAQGSPTNIRSQPPHASQRSSNMPYGSGQVPPGQGYGYSAQMWQGNPNAAAAAAAAAGGPQQSPIGSHSNMPQYSPQAPAHAQHHPQSPHPSQSPHNLPGQGGQHHQPGMQPPQQMGYQMPVGMQHTYGGMPGRNMYHQQPQQGPHSYMQQSGPGAAGGIAQWAPQTGQQNWQQQPY